MSWTKFQRNIIGKNLHLYGASLLNKTSCKDEVKNTALLRMVAKTNAAIRRNYSSRVESKLPPLHEDCYNMPSIFRTYRNNVRIELDIKMKIDKTFDSTEFLEGALEAQKVISRALVRSDYEFLQDLVAKEAIDSISDKLESLTPEQKKQIQIEETDIAYPFFYDVTVKKEAGNIQIVEILVVTKYCKDFNADKFSQLKFLDQMKKIAEDTYICNYNFIRKYKDDIASDWGINFVNHYHEAPGFQFNL